MKEAVPDAVLHIHAVKHTATDVPERLSCRRLLKLNTENSISECSHHMIM